MPRETILGSTLYLFFIRLNMLFIKGKLKVMYARDTSQVS